MSPYPPNFNSNNPQDFLDAYARLVPETFSPLVDRYGYMLQKDYTFDYAYRSEKLSLFIELDRTIIDVLFVPSIIEPGMEESAYMGSLIRRVAPDFKSRRSFPPKIKDFPNFVLWCYEEMVEHLEPLVAGDLSTWPRVDS